MGGAAKLVDKVKAGKAKLEGNIQVLEQLKVTLVKFDPFFEILPGTKATAAPGRQTLERRGLRGRCPGGEGALIGHPPGDLFG